MTPKRRLLITGGAGFIGSAVVRMALGRGYHVMNLDALTYAASPATLAGLDECNSYSFVKTDIRDRNTLDEVFKNFRPDLVMHLAAETHVDRSIVSPLHFVDTNITGTATLLEAARHYWELSNLPSGFRFHHVSTDEVFGSLPGDCDTKFSEVTRYDPRSPYSASKAACDHLVKAWHTTYGLPVVTSYCSNNYGPFQFPEKLVPVSIINALDGKPLPIYGNGANIRDWLYVDDHADALMTVLEKGDSGQSYAIGGNEEHTNIDLVHMICGLLDQKRPLPDRRYSDLMEFIPDRPGHDFRYAIDASKIRDTLGWKPRYSLKQGLENTVDWYLASESWWRPLLDRIRPEKATI